MVAASKTAGLLGSAMVAASMSAGNMGARHRVERRYTG